MYRIYTLESEHRNGPMLEKLAGQLSGLGYVLQAGKGHEAPAEDIKDSQPDLVLMDAELADQALVLCQQLKNDPDTESIPVIFLHAGGSPNGVLLKSFESGANDFISLEQPEAEIMARLQAALRTRQMTHHSVSLAQQLSRMNSELYERNLQVEKELYVARQLQQSLLPPFLPDEEVKEKDPDSLDRFSRCHYRDERLRISGVYLPCDALGGDIYDVIKFNDNSVGVTVADVSGHGVPAGFITAIYKSIFYRATHNYKKPGDILFQLNNALADIIKTGEYVTAIYCRIQPPDMFSNGPLQLDYSGAGHPYPLFYKKSDGSVTPLKENATPLVWVKNMEYPIGALEMEPGDRLLIYTDGVTEMRNDQGELFGDERLEQCFRTMSREHPSSVLDQLLIFLSDFTQGHPLEDDLSMVLIEAL